ncbi:MAG: acyltransferase family protein, partial [Lachnospiraceae bacterium]|nr:acyltransferase family protein [Lachnospiraceae bacterium]
VAGHAGYDILTVGGLFPYYSFHVPLFMFISGYFYRREEEEKPLLYVKKKGKRLLLPYFIWNVVYGIIAWALRAFGGFTIGEAISLKSLLLDPFLNGYQFLYNFAAWFVPVLFLIEVMNLCMRLVLKKLRLDSEWLILLGSLAVGMAVVQLSIGGHVWGLYKTPGRIPFLYPGFQMGQFYKKSWNRGIPLEICPILLLWLVYRWCYLCAVTGWPTAACGVQGLPTGRLSHM